MHVGVNKTKQKILLLSCLVIGMRLPAPFSQIIFLMYSNKHKKINLSRFVLPTLYVKIKETFLYASHY